MGAECEFVAVSASSCGSRARVRKVSPITGRSIVERRPPPFRTIVVDPPWAFQQKWLQAKKGNALTHDGLAGIFKFGGARGDAQAGIRGAAAQYNCMTLDEIKALPVDEWADADAHLYLWAPNAFILSGEAQAVSRAWGFEPYQLLTWGKGDDFAHQQLGMGMFYRNTTEQVIFAYRGRRGDPPVKSWPTLFFAQRRLHSEKPALFYDLVESMSPEPRLDVFARKHRFGSDGSRWFCYGDEVYSDIPLVEGAR